MKAAPSRYARALSWRKSYYYDRWAAYNAVQFFEREIYHVKGPLAGQPIRLEPWQLRIVRRLYGWKRREDGTRKHRVLFLFIARKNGKSTIGSGIALKGLFADGELGAEVVSAAVDREQARVIFDAAKQIIALNPRLSSLCTPYVKSIVVHQTASKYTVLSADVENKHGGNPSTIVFDELHTQPDGELVDVLKTGTAARLQPLQAYFTTAGYDKDSVCYEYYLKAKKLLAGEVEDPSFLPVVYEAADTDDWRDRETWKKANPGLGTSVQWSYIEEAYKEACENKRKENTFKRLHLNMWTEQLERWLPMDQWDECGVELFNPEDLEGQVCYGGLDLSTKVDVTALVLLFPDFERDIVRVLPFFWIPEDGMRRRAEKDGVPYVEWLQQGFLRVTPGERIDYDFIRADINEAAARFNIQEIGFDPWNATQIGTQLDGDGLVMVEVRQGYPRLSEPSKELEALLAARKLRHNGHPVLRRHAAYAACEEDAQGNIKPSKARSKDRIDGIVALIIGLSRLIVHRDQTSPYEEEGLFVLG